MQNPLYDEIGKGYNSTRQADAYLTERLYSLVASVPGGKYMDIGCGTGNYTIALAKRGNDICGLDPSGNMLSQARERDRTITWIQGEAGRLPMDDAAFDGVCGFLTLHHWPDLKIAFREVHRVLKPGGKAVFFTSTPEQMRRYWLNHYFPHMLARSIEQMPSTELLSSVAESAGLKPLPPELYFVKDDLSDLFLYAGKNRPQLYLDARVRHGISSFAALSAAAEVAEGLEALKSDLQSGAFNNIQKSFDHAGGDYLFTTFEK